MKKLFALLLCVMLILSMHVVTFAAETSPDTSSVQPSSSRAAVVPTTSHSTPYTMTITNLEEQHSTYTKYYFSPNNEELDISGTLRESGTKDGVNRSAKILLFLVGDDDTNIDSYTVSDFSGSVTISHTFQNLIPNAHYYFRIDNLNVHPPYAYRYIDGSITIS